MVWLLKYSRKLPLVLNRGLFLRSKSVLIFFLNIRLSEHINLLEITSFQNYVHFTHFTFGASDFLASFSFDTVAFVVLFSSTLEYSPH